MKTTKIFTHHFQTGGSMKTQDIKSFVFTLVMTLSVLCAAAAPASAIMDIAQTLSDGAQRNTICLLYTSPSPRDGLLSRMPSSA